MLRGDEMDTTLKIDGASIISPEAADGNYNILAIGNDILAFGPEIDPIAANNLRSKQIRIQGIVDAANRLIKKFP